MDFIVLFVKTAKQVCKSLNLKDVTSCGKEIHCDEIIFKLFDVCVTKLHVLTYSMARIVTIRLAKDHLHNHQNVKGSNMNSNIMKTNQMLHLFIQKVKE